MATTPILGLRYPASGDPADVPADMQNLATDVDNAAVILQAKKSIVAADQNTTSSSYTYLGTADKVTGIVLPTDGLIVVSYSALWQNNAVSVGRAALFIGANQYKVRKHGALAPVLVAGVFSPSVNVWAPLVSAGAYGIVGAYSDSTSDVTTGQGLGVIEDESQVARGYAEIDGTAMTILTPAAAMGATYIKAAAGTYDVGVKFKTASGTLHVKERELRVWTMAFDA